MVLKKVLIGTLGPREAFLDGAKGRAWPVPLTVRGIEIGQIWGSVTPPVAPVISLEPRAGHRHCHWQDASEGGRADGGRLSRAVATVDTMQVRVKIGLLGVRVVFCLH